jgi:Flp pilus assembly pilin Flp
MIDRFNAWATVLVGRIAELKNERGQTAVEYALMLAVVVIGLVTVALWSGLGTAIGSAVNKVATAISGA